ncbi:MAG: glycine cleavage system aminomethyltransferase GcvT [Planctomycetota bacterium]
MGRQTPLHAWHVKAGARIIDFGGWDMPVVYSSILEEHAATRSAAGLFDISHMGRLRFEGPDAVRFLDHVLTNRVDNLKSGQARYALVLNEAGCVLDDVLVYRMEGWHLLVVNASNREKLLQWFETKRKGFDFKLTDLTDDYAMVACQGPRAAALSETVFGEPLGHVEYYSAVDTRYRGEPAILSRTGYTGEDGFEWIVPRFLVESLWTSLLDAGASDGVKPVGLGARDTLRLEAGMPLYGHELTESIDPLQAGLGWAVKAELKEFIGKAALVNRPVDRPIRVGLKLADKRIAREGFAIEQNGREVGHVSSGTFAPTVGASIAMGYVAPPLARLGQALEVRIRNALVSAQVVSLPFYKRKKS